MGVRSSGSSSARFAARIVTGLGSIVRFLLSPLRGPHRHRTGFDRPVPPQPASRPASSPDWVRSSGSSSARFAARIVTGLGSIVRFLLSPLRGPHRHRTRWL
ncbi:hypothetical protein I553_6472 [Mycobacterium xenopi 4042]|uniref:Uncharacterized protein n=1 Tax=Mycobacterium xenopi 4042 TaxID=1299334 RepID=X8BEP7_MYCXE|nr:hypothetical protein I552_6316 [Mycobacterium xenopi 3993]EUA42612.1 hypothetical protein I553_6472 [Mycobacterium xenopi 4042]